MARCSAAITDSSAEVHFPARDWLQRSACQRSQKAMWASAEVTVQPSPRSTCIWAGVNVSVRRVSRCLDSSLALWKLRSVMIVSSMAWHPGATRGTEQTNPLAAPESGVVGRDEARPNRIRAFRTLLGEPLRGDADPLRSVATAGETGEGAARDAGRSEIRGVRFGEEPLPVDELRDLGGRFLAPPEHEAAERDGEAHLQRRDAVVKRP